MSFRVAVWVRPWDGECTIALVMLMTSVRPAGDYRGPARPFRRLGERIRAYRRAAHLTQEEAAKSAGIAQSYQSALERGISRPEVEVLRRVAAAVQGDYTDLAVLAGYQEQPSGSAVIYTTEDKAPILRRLAERPAYLLEAYERFIADTFNLHQAAQTEAHDATNRQERRGHSPDAPADLGI